MSSKSLAQPGGVARVIPSLQVAAASERAGDDFDIVALGQSLWRGKLWILSGLLLVTALSWFWVSEIAVPRYTATATVVLEPSQASVVSLESVVSGLGSDQMSVNTEAEVLMSRRLIELVADRLDLGKDPEFNPWALSGAEADAEAVPAPAVQRDATIRQLSGAFSIANVRASYVFRITAVSTDRAKSAALANTLAQVYVADRLQVKFDATQAATGWLTERVASLKSELEAHETAVQAFAAETDLVSPEALDALGRQLKDTRARLESLGAARDTAAAGYRALGAAIAAGDVPAMVAAARDTALTRLAERDGAEADILARARLVLARFEAERDGAAARIASLAISAEALNAAWESQSADLVRLEQMRRETEASRALYEYFLTRLKETAVQQGIQQADARLLSEAAVPFHPASPKVFLVLTLAALGGAIAGGVIVLARDLFNTGFRTAEALESETGHAVFGQIPRIRARRRAEVIDHLVEKPASAAAEAVRNLRTSLILSNVDQQPKVILSTSAVPGEGKTTIAFALAQNFAGLGQKVLLVEGDLRRRIFSQYVDVETQDGLLAVLAGEKSFEAVVNHVDRLGIDVLLGGTSAANAADLFSSDRFAALVAGLRQRYDVVVIDMPPVLLVPDARIVAQLTDAVLFCVRWDHTSRAQVAEALRQFEPDAPRIGAPRGGASGRATPRIAGLVLTQIDPKGMRRYGYGGKYGAYGTYQATYYPS